MFSRVLVPVALLAVLGGCSKSAPREAAPGVAAAPAATATSGSTPFLPSARAQTVDLSTARRVIRTAEVSLEADAPDAAAARLASFAEGAGGFVVSSDTSRSSDPDGAEYVTTTLVFRVPAGVFDAAIAAIHGAGRVSTEKVAGQDVTEEYVDLEARVRAQRAIEEQYLGVLHQAKTIPDILAVEQKLGEVRTEIERAEGRRRFLENQTSLSTLTVHVSRHFAAVETAGPGFGRSVREAGRDAVSVAVAIVNGAIRTAGVLLPVSALVGVPIWLLVRALRRRRRRLASGTPG